MFLHIGYSFDAAVVVTGVVVVISIIMILGLHVKERTCSCIKL